ncbi:GTP-binding protein [Oceanobacillus damuensis]|uniref:GTP-binding protein n=1 Tax=Oceanobacillus damuensis TaxID=937928 RepID=UPI000833237B|nr:GTP-binding protein [Oceanobacillus damuensis]
MTVEKKLINKTYYKQFMDGKESIHPIKVLGEMYMTEQMNEVTDLASIRFSQGEVYFLNKDYEAAIFKWENISNELKPWAQKNIADAHFELDLLAIAEDYYKAVETDSEVLRTEVLLQLFSLYIQLGKLEKAAESIKKAVSLNPDYPDVTDMARAFFEDQQDFGNAVKLAVNEAIRTQSLSWFAVLETYAEMSHTSAFDPGYFKEALLTLYTISHARFESLTEALWNSYKQSDLYFTWLKDINHLFLHIDVDRSHNWQKLSDLYRESYVELIDGDHLIRDLSPIIPNLLNNWIKICTTSDALLASAAVLAWSDIFPSSMEASVVSKAEDMVSRTESNQIGVKDGYGLLNSIKSWAHDNGVLMSERFVWLAQELLDFSQHHLLISGIDNDVKTAFLNKLLGNKLLEDRSSAAAFLKHSEDPIIQAITNEEVRDITDADDLRQHAENREALVFYGEPVSFLKDNGITLIDAPGITSQSRSRNDLFPYLHVADSMLFVMDPESPMTAEELNSAVRIKERAPELQIHFVLYNTNSSFYGQEAMEHLDETTSKIKTYFPDATFLTLSATYESKKHLDELSSFMESIKRARKLEKERTVNVLYFIKESIKFLLGKRVDMENSLIDKVKWNEEMVTKLQGAVNQVKDMEEEKVQVIKTSYSEIKDKMRQDLRAKIPELLRDCADLVKEDSDFAKIHIELNEEMNKRITDYIETSVLPDYRASLMGWIVDSEREFKESQTNLKEMSDSFNQLYGEEKIALICDFKVLDDWRRDADRMTRGNVQLRKANILTRSTPSQLLFKSAGKLFGAIQNKGMLYNKYKQFIDSKDYSETAESITAKFMQQFELFENSLQRDVNMFFANPFEVLQRTLEETDREIEENQISLRDMRNNPELYQDPLTLFELKLRQYERMIASSEQVKEYY